MHHIPPSSFFPLLVFHVQCPFIYSSSYPSAPIIIYGYTPSYTLALVAAVLFGLSLLIHSFQVARYRAWYFVTVPLTCLLELLGYVFRTFSAHKDPYNVLHFVLQYFFIVTAPVFLSAGIYAILSILVNRVGRKYSPLPPRAILGIFITSDSVCTIIQICGAALIGSAESKNAAPSLGRNILLAGLCVQVFVFLIFVMLLSLFVSRAWKALWTKGRRSFLIAFGFATMLVYLRTCFRLAEVAQGVESFLFTHENYFIALECVPILAAVWLFNVWHPGRCLGKNTVGVVGY